MSPTSVETASTPETLREGDVVSDLLPHAEGAAHAPLTADVHETLVSSQSRPNLSSLQATGTQPSMPAYAESAPSSRDLRRNWHVDEQFHRQDARIRLLEKEILSVRRLALGALGLALLSAVIALRALL